MVGEELICELEFTNKFSRNSIELKSKNKNVTVSHVPESLAAIVFPLRKAWKVYEIQAKITGKSRRAPEGTWVLGGGIEIPCQYNIIGPKIHKKMLQKRTKKSTVVNFYELYLYIKYLCICVINNNQRKSYAHGLIHGEAGLYSGGLYTEGKLR